MEDSRPDAKPNPISNHIRILSQVDEMAQGADDGAGVGDDEMGEVAGVNGTTGGVSKGSRMEASVLH